MKAEDMNIKINVDDKAINEALEKAEKLKALTENLTWQNRLKSPVVWTSFAIGLLAILGEWGLYEKVGVDKEILQHTITFLISCFVMFGVLNNPNDKNSF